MPRTEPFRGETIRSLVPSVLLGFTLVEVMVALAVVAVALPALLLTLSQQLDGLRYLRTAPTHSGSRPIVWPSCGWLSAQRAHYKPGGCRALRSWRDAAGIGGARG